MHHHPPDDLLASYAAGAADDAESLLVATHLALCPRCREVSDRLDALGGAWIDRGLPHLPRLGVEHRDRSVELAPDALDRVLARLDEPAPPKPPMPPAGPLDLPMPLRGLTGPLAAVPFRGAGPGIRRFDLTLSRPDRPVALLSLRPGLRIPPHRHAGVERGLVLLGGYTDETGHFARGDVQIRGPDEEEPHRQRIDDGERCVVLMVDDAPKIPVTWAGRWLGLLFGS